MKFKLYKPKEGQDLETQVKESYEFYQKQLPSNGTNHYLIVHFDSQTGLYGFNVMDCENIYELTRSLLSIAEEWVTLVFKKIYFLESGISFEHADTGIAEKLEDLVGYLHFSKPEGGYLC